jgi:hypothetical protein
MTLAGMIAAMKLRELRVLLRIIHEMRDMGWHSIIEHATVRHTVLRHWDTRYALDAACVYSPALTGKLFRRALVLQKAAAAVELGHVASLVHDDIIDGDIVRRGRQSVVAAYSTPKAIATGDALLCRVARRPARWPESISSRKGRPWVPSRLSGSGGTPARRPWCLPSSYRSTS